MMEGMAQGLKDAARGLLRRPGFTFVAVLSLALGIGANTAVFSLVNTVLLRPLPVEAPEELVEIYTSDSGGFQYATFSWPDLRDLREEGEALFEGVAAYQLFIAATRRDGDPSLVMGELVTGGYFDMLGIPAALGRTFLPEEARDPGTHAVTVVSHAFWERELGGDPDAVGRSVRMNERPFVVVGVAPESFKGMMPGLVPDLWVPYAMADVLNPVGVDRRTSRGSRSLFVKGRLRSGITPEQADVRVRAFSERLAEAHPETNEGRVMSVLPTDGVAINPMVDRALVPVAGLLLGVVGLVLLITCANLASFLLARAEDRRRDVAVRLALGAGRGRLVGGFLLETMLLALAGGVAGLALAHWLVRLLVGFQPPLPVPVTLDVQLDGSVLLFAFGATAVAGLAFGLLPALRATAGDVAGALREGRTPEGTGPGGGRLRRGLVGTQVALSVLLLVAAGLFLRSLHEARSVDPGFYTGPAAILWPDFRLSMVPEEEGAALWRTLEERLEAHPAIEGVALADALPLGVSVQTTSLEIPGHTSDRPDGTFAVDYANVSPSWFDVMEVEVLRGRPFDASDRTEGSTSIIVSRAFEARFFPEGAMGGAVTGGGTERTIVGVAADTKVRTLGESPRPRVYYPAGSTYQASYQVVVRGRGTGTEILRAARDVLDQTRPGLVLFGAGTMAEHLGLMLFPPRMAALLLTAFGGLALLLAAIGLYGIVSYSVARRTREMGIRLSLGASPSHVVRLVVKGGMRLVSIGGAVGIVLALLAGSAISRFLVGVDGRDVLTFVAVPAVMLGVGFLASWIPALRATRLDPAEVLRAE